MYAARKPKGYQGLVQPHVAENPSRLRRVLQALGGWIRINGLDADRVQLIVENENWTAPARASEPSGE